MTIIDKLYLALCLAMDISAKVGRIRIFAYVTA